MEPERVLETRRRQYIKSKVVEFCCFNLEKRRVSQLVSKDDPVLMASAQNIKDYRDLHKTSPSPIAERLEF